MKFVSHLEKRALDISDEFLAVDNRKFMINIFITMEALMLSLFSKALKNKPEDNRHIDSELYKTADKMRELYTSLLKSSDGYSVEFQKMIDYVNAVYEDLRKVYVANDFIDRGLKSTYVKYVFGRNPKDLYEYHEIMVNYFELLKHKTIDSMTRVIAYYEKDVVVKLPLKSFEDISFAEELLFINMMVGGVVDLNEKKINTPNFDDAKAMLKDAIEKLGKLSDRYLTIHPDAKPDVENFITNSIKYCE